MGAPKIKTGYKIVLEVEDGYYSMYYHDLKKYGVIVEYKINEWIYPPKHCGGLSVFGKLKYAKRFKKFKRHYLGITPRSIFKIFKCKYEIMGDLPRIGDIQHAKANGLIQYDDQLPDGTEMAKKVMLVEEVM